MKIYKIFMVKTILSLIFVALIFIDFTGCLLIFYAGVMLLWTLVKYEQWKQRPKVSEYETRRDDSPKIFSTWDYIYIAPAVTFILLRVLWWPSYQDTLDAEVAALMDYDVVWYDPERPREWIFCVTLFVIGLFLLKTMIEEWKEIMKESNESEESNKDEDKEKSEKSSVFIAIVWTLLSLTCCIVPTIMAYNSSDNISAIYFGNDKVAVVGDWTHDKIIVSDLVHLTCRSKTKIKKNKNGKITSKWKYWILQYSGGNSCKVEFEDDSKWHPEWHPAIVKSDRKAVCEKLEKLEEAGKVQNQ